MKYNRVVPAVFLDRPNRFVAHAELNGRVETVHVKNTGRCRELLVPGAEIYLAEGSGENRKTGYDLIAVRKSSGILFNIDSQAPNRVVREWLEKSPFSLIVPEYRYGESRLDFYMEKNEEKFLLEVKGCTLEIDGIGYFPDAPTERGVRHLRELIHAAGEGIHAAAAFVIQMDGVTEVRPNAKTHPEFADVFSEAERAGVEMIRFACHVEPDSIEITSALGWRDHHSAAF